MTTMQGTFPRRPDMVTIVQEQQQQQQAETTQTASEYKTSCSRRSFRSFCRSVGGLGLSAGQDSRSVDGLGLSVCRSFARLGLSVSPVALLVVLVRQIMPIKRWENELATLLHACLHYAASVWVFGPQCEWGDWKDQERERERLREIDYLANLQIEVINLA